MIDIRELGANQIDALREVANTGAGHAATALSQMTDARINVSVPRLQIARLDEISELIFDGESMVTAVMMHVLGDLSGRTLLVLPRDSGAHLASCESETAPDHFGFLRGALVFLAASAPRCEIVDVFPRGPAGPQLDDPFDRLVAQLDVDRSLIAAPVHLRHLIAPCFNR